MWTKFVNWLGYQTKAQQLEAAARQAAMNRRARARQAQRRAQSVITTDQVPRKTKRPTKTSQQVRQDQYGYSEHDAYLTPGFNNYYEPTVYSTPECPPSSSNSYDSSPSYSSGSDSSPSSFSCD